MSRLVAALVLFSSVARADVPPGITQRIVQYIFDGCDYLHAHSWKPPGPHPSEKKHAEHFGTITSAKRDGLPMRYFLKVAAFPEWSISYWHDNVEMKLPPQVAITMGDLQRLLGPDSAQDVMYAVSTTSGPPRPTVTRVFTAPNRQVCRVDVETENDPKKGAARRVFKIEFAD